MAVASRCCFLWGRRGAAEPLTESFPSYVKDDKDINLKGAARERSSSVGERVRKTSESVLDAFQVILATPRSSLQSCARVSTDQSQHWQESPERTSPKLVVETDLLPVVVSADVAAECSEPAVNSCQTHDDMPPAVLPPRHPTIKASSVEDEALLWIEAVCGEEKGDEPLMEWLKDGQVLCRTANKIQEGICPRINKQKMPFQQMENVTAFIQACRKLGVLEKDVFSTVDLYEGKSPKSVINCIVSLGAVVRRTAPSFRGPYIGAHQNAVVKDAAREKVVVTQDSGFRSDITHEVRAGVSKARRI